MRITELLGRLTGRPRENGLHVHPLYKDLNNIPMADGTTDENMSVHLTSRTVSREARLNTKSSLTLLDT